MNTMFQAENNKLRNDIDKLNHDLVNATAANEMYSKALGDLQAENEALKRENGNLRRRLDIALELAQQAHVRIVRLQHEVRRVLE